MKRFSLLIIILTLFCLNSFSAEKKWEVSSITPSLLQNANTVLRFYEMKTDIGSSKKIVTNISCAVTILKNNSIDRGILQVRYSSFSKVRKLKGAVYDADGNRVQKFEYDDFQDFSAISGSSTYSDERVIICRPKYLTVPFTVEYSFENEAVNYEIPSFNIIQYDESVEFASLTVTIPDTLGLRYYQRNISDSCSVTAEDGLSTYHWELKNITPYKNEYFSPGIEEIAPNILLSTNSFQVKGRYGKKDSWLAFGQWYSGLLKGRDDLNDESRMKIRQMTVGMTDTLEIIRKLYGYMQEKVRYVCVYEGIGAMQPALASEVDIKSYGDCKGLVNYMKCLLSCAGIKSYFTLVNAGMYSSKIVKEFPSFQFNHAILCVPVNNDTLWLECTSSGNPAGYTGTFTDGRYVLVVNDNGGYLCRTPLYDEKINIWNRFAEIVLDEKGNGVAKILADNKGIYFDQKKHIVDLDSKDKKESILEDINAPAFSLDSFRVSINKADYPVFNEQLKLTLHKLLIPAGNMVLLMPNQLAREAEMSSQVLRRTTSVEIRRSKTRTDTIVYILPAGFSVNGNPLAVNITSKYGEYKASTEVKNDRLYYTRRFTIRKGKYPASEYEEFLKFYEKVALADSKKVALKKQADLN